MKGDTKYGKLCGCLMGCGNEDGVPLPTKGRVWGEKNRVFSLEMAFLCILSIYFVRILHRKMLNFSLSGDLEDVEDVL